ncbi:hypothetical protein SAMN05444372_103218 [Flavobacterium micromati]|uniref:Uncharacterized protein n=1 Tax=Flavobacterium micromati TaxID=229205 RepID=A0A1M5I0Q7_9FLAO|nr:hypothetical protein [Flavobacterium micromati]MCL6460646.1 hypothetical protein [Flavobacterium micromati]SHG21630.1 hypothetical protein SAMN05444372_103218 [Flavobacterium micromati]
MNNINHTETLQEAIQLLKMQQAGQLDLLKEQYRNTYEHLKPINILKRSFNQLTSTADFKGSVVSNIVGIGTGYLTKKVLLGSTPNIFKKVLGTLLQLAITNVVTKKTEKSIDNSIHNVQDLSNFKTLP